jgi:hypothetical protein
LHDLIEYAAKRLQAESLEDLVWSTFECIVDGPEAVAGIEKTARRCCKNPEPDPVSVVRKTTAFAPLAGAEARHAMKAWHAGEPPPIDAGHAARRWRVLLAARSIEGKTELITAILAKPFSAGLLFSPRHHVEKKCYRLHSQQGLSPMERSLRLTAWDGAYSLNMAIACAITYWIITYLLSGIVDQASDFLAGMWAVVAAVFVLGAPVSKHCVRV